MKRRQRTKAIWIGASVALVMAAIVVPLLVFADSGQPPFTATLYSDVIRFEADGVASLRVTIYDLSENELWSSAQVMGDFVDWGRANERGERLANGYYMYLAEGWDSSDTLILNKTGKVVLLPGDQVQLASAPVGSASGIGDAGADSGDDPVVSSKDVYGTLEDTGIFGTLGVGTASPGHPLQVTGSVGSTYIDFSGIRVGFSRPSANYIWAMSPGGYYCFGVNGTTPGLANSSLILQTTGSVVMPNGNAGIGTFNATDKLTIQGSSGNLIACYPNDDRGGALPNTAAVFRVEADGDVYADGTVYANDHIDSSSADIAERVNTSEWVEAGDVVEIDPDHVGFFRKATGLYSRRVAGIISTSPGVVLGNDVDDATGNWDDNRPVLAIAGRVPVKVSTENGPIAVGDLLVSSSASGIAMRGDPAVSIGAVVGKAMEPLVDGEGVIMAQVTLR